MSKREFEFSDGTSNKFWSIELKGRSHTVHYGRVGSKGRSNQKQFASPSEAAKDCEKLINQKLKKGYLECPTKTGDFEDIYLVSDKISPVNAKEINALERKIGSLPNGYRKFMRHCGGEGDLCDDIRVWPPAVILKNVEREREYMTFAHCVDPERDACGLEGRDFEDIWIFGSDGNGNNYCYFPRHEGTLFELLHESGVVRFDQAFLEVSRIWCDGRVRHPFPYFDPRRGKSNRYLKAFSVYAPLKQKDIADIVVDYWKAQDIDSIVVKMPPQHEGGEADDHIVFVKSIGCSVDIGCDEVNYPGKVYGYIRSDREHWTEARRCLKAIEAAAE